MAEDRGSKFRARVSRDFLRLVGFISSSFVRFHSGCNAVYMFGNVGWILALLVDCKSRPLESCVLMFIEVMSIDCDSLMSLLLSVSFSSLGSFKGEVLSKLLL
jgi:hypothetical protein